MVPNCPNRSVVRSSRLSVRPNLIMHIMTCLPSREEKHRPHADVDGPKRTQVAQTMMDAFEGAWAAMLEAVRVGCPDFGRESPTSLQARRW
jgi:hypothetical protein